MRQPLVIGFVAENANRVLEDSSLGLGTQFARLGYKLAVLNLYDPGCFDRLKRLASADDLQFCFGYAGIGAHLRDGDTPLWDKAGVPFLSLLYDHPFYHPSHHAAPSRFVCNCYGIQDFLAVQRAYVQSPQPSTLLAIASVGYADPLNPDWVERSWRDRDVPPLLIKTGGDLRALTASFEVMPPSYRALVWDCIDLAQRDAGLDLAAWVKERLEALGLAVAPEQVALWDDFIYLTRVIDQYLRHWRSDDLVEGLKDQPILIIGDGWDHIDKTNARAEFRPALPIEQAKMLMYRTRCLLNVHPYARYAWHERVFFGLELGTCVISDRTRFTDRYFSQLPNFIGFDWGDPQRYARLKDSLAAVPAMTFSNEPAARCLAEHFPPDATVKQMIALAGQMRNGATIV